MPAALPCQPFSNILAVVSAWSLGVCVCVCVCAGRLLLLHAGHLSTPLMFHATLIYPLLFQEGGLGLRKVCVFCLIVGLFVCLLLLGFFFFWGGGFLFCFLFLLFPFFGGGVVGYTRIILFYHYCVQGPWCTLAHHSSICWLTFDRVFLTGNVRFLYNSPPKKR